MASTEALLPRSEPGASVPLHRTLVSAALHILFGKIPEQSPFPGGLGVVLDGPALLQEMDNRLKDNNGIDIYQLASIGAERADLQLSLKLRAALSLCFQTFPVLHLANQITSQCSEKLHTALQEGHEEPLLGVMTRFFLLLFILLYCFKYMSLWMNQSLYGIVLFASHNVAHPLSLRWLTLGFVANANTAGVVVACSCQLLMSSTNAVDMLLNFVAMFFLSELDDILVRPEDVAGASAVVERWLAADRAAEAVLESGKERSEGHRGDSHRRVTRTASKAAFFYVPSAVFFLPVLCALDGLRLGISVWRLRAEPRPSGFESREAAVENCQQSYFNYFHSFGFL